MDRIPNSTLGLSALALIGIMSLEGYRQYAYDDGGGVQSFGFGSTTINGQPVKPTDTITPVRAAIQMGADVSAIEKALHSCLGNVPLHQREWDAFVSLAYNIGSGAFCKSTLVKILKSAPAPPGDDDYVAACAQILRWDKVRGKQWPGLTKRRQAEYERCMGDAP